MFLFTSANISANNLSVAIFKVKSMINDFTLKMPTGNC